MWLPCAMAYWANGAIERWLAQEVEEEVLEPELPIVDPVRSEHFEATHASVSLPFSVFLALSSRLSVFLWFLSAVVKLMVRCLLRCVPPAASPPLGSAPCRGPKPLRAEGQSLSVALCRFLWLRVCLRVTLCACLPACLPACLLVCCRSIFASTSPTTSTRAATMSFRRSLRSAVPCAFSAQHIWDRHTHSCCTHVTHMG